MESEGLRLAGLPVTQTRKLLGISKNEFNLEPGFVIGEDELSIEFNIGREQQCHPCFAWFSRIN